VTDVAADKLTHINYAFANISPEGEISLGDEYADTQFLYPSDVEGQELAGNFNQLNLLKQKYPHVQTLISVGGWTWSDYFSDVALTEASRAKFAASCVAFIKKYAFDGVDLDWEYPAGGGEAGNVERPEDPENFVLLLEAIRSALDEQGETDGRHYLQTIAVGAGVRHANSVDWTRAAAALDWINIMTYDFSGAWSQVTGFNAPLHNSSGNPPEGGSADTSVQGYLAAKVPAEKLVLGVPFYGRGWTGVQAANNGLHQPYTSLPNGDGSFTYADLAANYIRKLGYERNWSAEALVPWLFDARSGTLISYDDPESIALKAQYVVDNDLGGIMIWEVGGDTRDAALLTSVYDTLAEGN
jgi:chitinase